jgi:uncharacterized repeat protein (TIGR04042 family)
MPELLFDVRWPDQSVTRCYSPSRAIAAHLDAGRDYPLPEFLSRSRAGLQAASDRVREVYGAPCSRAAAQLAEIERLGARFGEQLDARVRVVSIEMV